VKGKAIVVFVNDPGYDTATETKPLFKGKNMTYFGRWTYKVRPQIRTYSGAFKLTLFSSTKPSDKKRQQYSSCTIPALLDTLGT